MAESKSTKTRSVFGRAVLPCVAVFIATSVYAMPASVLRFGVDQISPNFQYQSIEGNWRNGAFKGVRVGDAYLGEVRYKLSPLSLFTGAVKARINARGGALVGDGDIRIGMLDRSAALSNATFDFDLSSIRRYTLYGVPYQGTVRANVRRLAFSEDGCRKADADLWTDAMAGPAKKLSGAPLDLKGDAACRDDKLYVRLDGAAAPGEIVVEALLSPMLNYTMVATIVPRRTELQQALTLLGFERSGQKYVYDTIGEIKGLGS